MRKGTGPGVGSPVPKIANRWNATSSMHVDDVENKNNLNDDHRRKRMSSRVGLLQFPGRQAKMRYKIHGLLPTSSKFPVDCEKINCHTVPTRTSIDGVGRIGWFGIGGKPGDQNDVRPCSSPLGTVPQQPINAFRDAL